MIVKIIGTLFFSLVGAFYFRCAVRSLINGNYLLFGSAVFLTGYSVVSIFQIVLED